MLTLPLLYLAFNLKQYDQLSSAARLTSALVVFIGNLCITLLQERQRNLWAPLLAMLTNNLLTIALYY